MFSNYRTVFWLSAVMALFVFAPFYVTGYSTDVWTRLARIMEWHALDFPWREYMTVGQNYPFGQELHWTRPLDVIGYAFAWTFVPVWGIKEALEIMATFVPFLVLLLGIRGYFYGVRGYLTPKMAFFGFWLFFYAIGYIWGQSAPGYYDHHVFHFTLLMWLVALTARSFIATPKTQNYLMAGAGILTALGTWITAEFSINIIFVALPFAVRWLLMNKPLKPLTIYFFTLTVSILLPLTFDHMMSGFSTLDMYRFSLFHALLGGLGLGICLILTEIFNWMRTSFLRRLIYGILIVLSAVSLLVFCFSDVVLKPMTDPFVYHLWVKKVTEMAPLTDDWTQFFRNVIVVGGMVLYMLVALWKKKENARYAIWIMVLAGLVFYTGMMISHVRVGISVDVFFIWTASLFLNYVFFPREKSFKLTLGFILFYGLFMGTTLKGRDILNRFVQFGVSHYREAYENNPNMELPDILKEAFAKEKAENAEKELALEKKVNELFNQRKEDDSFSCKIPDEVFKTLKELPTFGGVLTDIFQAPQVLWETARPVWGGPYHDMVAPHVDMIRVFFDGEDDFKTARHIMDKRQTKLVFMVHPKCMAYLFWDDKNHKLREGLDNYFYFQTYYELKKRPSWLKRVYYDEPSGVKIFEVADKPVIGKNTKKSDRKKSKQ